MTSCAALGISDGSARNHRWIGAGEGSAAGAAGGHRGDPQAQLLRQVLDLVDVRGREPGVGLEDHRQARPGRGLVAVRLGHRGRVEPQERILTARLTELDSQLRNMQVQDRVQAQIVKEEISYTEKELARVRERLSGLTVTAPSAGRFVVPEPADMPARFVRKGEQLGFVAPKDRRLVRVVVEQDDVDLVRSHTHAIKVRLAEKVPEVLPASVLREVPAASGELPSLALSERGGGRIALDPRQTERPTALNPVFHFELSMPPSQDELHIGGRVHVLFEHDAEPLGNQAWRGLRRLFLRRFTV